MLYRRNPRLIQNNRRVAVVGVAFDAENEVAHPRASDRSENSPVACLATQACFAGFRRQGQKTCSFAADRNYYSDFFWGVVVSDEGRVIVTQTLHQQFVL
jgi:hypothetical protein